MRFGPGSGPVVIMLLPLFEEHNRTRTFAITICRGLAGLGVAVLLPDLPGQGESIVATEQATLPAWRDAVLGLIEAQRAVRPVVLASMRGGALMDSVAGVCGVWRLAPIAGQAVVRGMTRGQSAASSRTRSAPDGAGMPLDMAGNRLSHALVDALNEHDVASPPPAPVRTVRLDSDPAPADATFPGPPLWHRAEPGNDPALAALLAADIADWVRQCVG